MKAMSVKTTKILHLISRVNDEVAFGRQEDLSNYAMTDEEWANLGEPTVITVSVEPGDKLND